MPLELRRFVRSPFALVSFLIGMAFFPFAYVLGLGWDQSGSISWVLLNAYMVFTQFGMFILPAVMAAFVAKDYNEKTLLFYKSRGFSALRYHATKVVLLSAAMSFGCAVGLTGVCVAFGNFEAWLMVLAHCVAVVVTYYSFSAFLTWLLGSFIKSYFAAFAYFLAALMVAVKVPDLRFLHMFDQNGFVYKDLAASIFNLSTFNAVEAPHVVACLLYALAVFVLMGALSLVFKKRWLVNGI